MKAVCAFLLSCFLTITASEIDQGRKNCEDACYAGPALGFTENVHNTSLVECFSTHENSTICSEEDTLCVGGRSTVAVYKISDKSELQSAKEECKQILVQTTSKLEGSVRALEQLFGEIVEVKDAASVVRLIKEIMKLFKRKEVYQNFYVFKKYQEKFITALSTLIEGEYKAIWRGMMQNLITAVEELPTLLLRSMQSASSTTKLYNFDQGNIRMTARQELLTNNSKLPLEFKSNSAMSAKSLIILESPFTEQKSSSEPIVLGVSAIMYNNISELLPVEFKRNSKADMSMYAESPAQVVSPVVTIVVQLNNSHIKDINGTFELAHANAKQRFSQSDNLEHSFYCVYWQKNESLSTNGAWSTYGIRLIDSHHGNTTLCHTNHLTSFAILMQTKNVKISSEDERALEIITYVGCSISLVCLAITIISMPFLRLTSTLRYKIHMQLCISLAVSQAAFLLGIAAIRYKVACMITAMSLHYFYTAAFSWMFLEGFHLYMKIVIAYEKKAIKQLYYFCFGWGFPFIIVGISSAVNSEGYGTEAGCWLSLERGFRWVFIGPVLIILAINLCIMIKVLHIMMVLQNDPLKKKKNSRLSSLAKGLAVLLPLLGLTWLFGVLCVNSQTIVFQYIFAVLNSLQGAFIFLLNYAGNREVRSSFRQSLQRSQMSTV
ncbi:adhesion G protein-coupled receptor L1 isoform X3 [Nematostella vectensis]|uniref:adhesion G protein-coupled receptor L1 isoform X3 n=1 Tax=Nematostella vectensis TaxID=45351 RepID=UPI0020775374|nr:adhesion G protein-coupled receptor L1 isoform X3 [Nematostella vectensis]